MPYRRDPIQAVCRFMISSTHAQSNALVMICERCCECATIQAATICRLVPYLL